MPEISFVKCVVVDGKAYANIAEAQTAILTNLFRLDKDQTPYIPSGIAEKILAERDQILAALTLTEAPRRRSPGRPKGSRNKPKGGLPSELPGIQTKVA